ncbi:MAG: hypothetical protein JNM89_15360 [Hyphomicrobiaceae bacterium]|nr:hypothetical protein [Hyphomicrobiaceae bacterium]
MSQPPSDGAVPFLRTKIEYHAYRTHKPELLLAPIRTRVRSLIMTNDPLIQAAQDRLREILAERDELETFIEMHRRLSKKLFSEQPRTEPPPKPASSVATNAGRANSTVEILDAAARILNKHGKPMRLADLHDALTGEGIVVPGSDPRNNLSAKLYSSDRFATQRGIGWWFASQLSEPVTTTAPEAPVNGSSDVAMAHDSSAEFYPRSPTG